MSADTFRERVRGRERLLGTFVKTPAYQSVEVVASGGLDFALIDAEHAPFDRCTLDAAVLAARASQLPVLVRIPDNSAATILNVLDIGATGVVVPHMRDPDQIAQVFAATRYRSGGSAGRGFSNSPRAGGYGGIGMEDLIPAADKNTVVICQIEDKEAVEKIERIAAIDDVDCLFIGKADLAVSCGFIGADRALLDAAVERICAACNAAGKAVGIFLPNLDELSRYEDLGVTLFVIGSDQALLKMQLKTIVSKFRE
ncbi:MAG TPA: aldolase/citrate lyase family protein [Noviherbaspirillum sp.]|uniref:HpcH/HpaI aldolase family protein n=1 Tax=Noviherbaspirillum sp. TaxID=1926288 RepID=UPI002D349DD9|nr:aldolase/citrate lyase family protein [Noviherbaspirillum sp.]HYD94678.1 aldolase/citrate lyase family protein [Noviherbaspirillum sp.]